MTRKLGEKEPDEFHFDITGWLSKQRFCLSTEVISEAQRYSLEVVHLAMLVGNMRIAYFFVLHVPLLRGERMTDSFLFPVDGGSIGQIPLTLCPTWVSENPTIKVKIAWRSSALLFLKVKCFLILGFVLLVFAFIQKLLCY